MAIQWSLVLFTALTGLAGWMFAAIAISEVKGVMREIAFPAGLSALIVLLVGGCCSVTHLSHPERMMAALGHPTSGIFTEAVLVGVTAILAIVYLVLLKREVSAGARKVVACMTAIVGVVLSFMAGASYMMVARASWNTVLLPLGYLATSIPAGISAYLMVAAAKKQAIDELFPKILLIGGIIAAACAALYSVASGRIADSIVCIWLMSVVIGGALPAVMGAMVKKNPEKALSFVVVSLVGAIVGSIAYRCFMWIAATNIDNFFQTL